MKNNPLLILLFFSAFSCKMQAQNINKPNIPFVEGLHVNSYSGALFYQRSDLYIPGRGPSIDVTFFYNSANTALDWGYGHGWTMTYSMDVKVEGTNGVVRWGDGRKDIYTLNGNIYTPPVGIFDSITEYQPGRFRLRTIYGMQYFFNDSSHHKVTSIVDANGNTLSLTYTNSLLSSITDASGRSINLTYSNGHLTQINDPNTSPARHILILNDASGNPVTVTNFIGHTMQYEYDDVHNMTKVIDEAGSAYNIAYLNCATVQNLSSPLNSMSFSFNANLLTTTDSMLVDGVWQSTSYEFDSLGNIKEKMGSCCGYHQQFTYDTQKNISQRIDANGKLYTYQYDVKGNMTQEKDPLNHTVNRVYEPMFSNLTSMTDKNGNQTTYAYDIKGNLSQINKPLSVTELISYDNYGNMISVTDGKGFVTHYQYNANADLTMITYPDSSTETFTYNNVGLKLSETDALGRTTNYVYDLANRKLQMINALGYTTQYAYDSRGNLITETDPLMHVTTHQYDALTRRISTTALAGTSYQTYNQKGKTKSTTDRNGNVRTFLYNTQNLVVTETDPLSHSRNITYDANGNKLTETDYNGNQTTYVYDAANRLTTITDALANQFTYTYDANGNRTGVTNALNQTTTNVYDALNRYVQMQQPIGTISFTYDANNNKVTSTDANANVTTYSYDNRNRKIAETDALNHSETMTYDDVGNLLTSTNKVGLVTSFTYDSLNRKITETLHGSETITYTYDADNRMISKTLPTGNSITYTYDAAHRVIAMSDVLGGFTTFTYDANGNRLTQADANSNTTLFTYNALNKNTSVTDPLGHTTSFVYDNNSNIISKQDMNMHSDLASYDALNRKISATNSLGHTSTMTYNSLGNMLSVTDANLHTTNYAYDANGRLVSETFADNSTKLTSYDAVGNKIALTDNNGVVTSQSYNATNRNTLKNYPGANDDVYTFDNQGRLLTANNSNAAITFTYNSAGRVASETLNGKTITYTYNLAARKRTITYPSGRKVEETYDQRIRPTAIIQPAIPADGPSAAINFATFTYNAIDQVQSISRQNGVTTNYTRNANSWVTSLNHTGTSNVAQINYTFDNQGNFLTEEKVHHPTHSEKHTYTNEDQLSNYKEGVLSGGNIAAPLKQTQFNFDSVDNRTSVITTVPSIPSANNYVFSQSVGAGLEPMVGAGVTQLLSPNNDDNPTTALNIGFNFMYEGNVYTTFSMSPDGFIKLGTAATQEPNNLIAHTLNRPKLMAMWDNLATGTTGNGKMKLIGTPGNQILVLQWFVTIPRNVNGAANSTFQMWLYEATGIIEFRYGIGNATTGGATVGINSVAGNPGNFISVSTASHTSSTSTPNNSNNNWPGNTRNYTFAPLLSTTTTTNYTSNSVNKYIAINTLNPIYDANGNTLNDGIHTYQYNTQNQLISVDGGLTVIYKYDALGRRIQKVTSSGTINYYYNLHQVIEERNASDSVLATYVYGAEVDEILSMRRGGMDYFYHLDYLGSVIAVTNNTGAVVERYDYDPFGTPTIYDSAFVLRTSSLIGNPYLFTAREYNPETGHYHYRARSYNPAWGRFDQWDPLGYVDGYNLFIYSANNPVTGKDPCGQAVKLITNGNSVTVLYGTELTSATGTGPIGTLDPANGIIQFDPALGIGDMPIDIFNQTYLGQGPDAIDNFKAALKAKQNEAEGQGGYKKGENPADYYHLRVTAADCAANASKAEADCLAKVKSMFNHHFKGTILKGAAATKSAHAAGAAAVAGAACPPAALAGAVVSYGFGLYAIIQLIGVSYIFEAYEKAEKLYCNCAKQRK